jgi:hypothetical protein
MKCFHDLTRNLDLSLTKAVQGIHEREMSRLSLEKLGGSELRNTKKGPNECVYLGGLGVACGSVPGPGLNP